MAEEQCQLCFFYKNAQYQLKDGTIKDTGACCILTFPKLNSIDRVKDCSVYAEHKEEWKKEKKQLDKKNSKEKLDVKNKWWRKKKDE